MKTTWTKGLSGQAKIDCQMDFVGAASLRERLKALLLEKAEQSRTSMRASYTYDNPNWALVQADAIGYEKALFEVISLIS